MYLSKYFASTLSAPPYDTAGLHACVQALVDVEQDAVAFNPRAVLGMPVGKFATGLETRGLAGSCMARRCELDPSLKR